MAEKEQLNEENMNNQDIKREINNDNKEMSTQPGASKMLPGFVKRKCTTLETEQGPSMPKLVKAEFQPDPHTNITIRHDAEEELNQPAQNNPQPFARAIETNSSDDSDTDTDSSDSDDSDAGPLTARARSRLLALADRQFDAAISSVFTPMTPAVLVETLPQFGEPSVIVPPRTFPPREPLSDFITTIPRLARPIGISAQTFTPLQLVDTIQPTQRLAFCVCRRRAELERILRAKRRRELLMIRKPPLVLQCRAYEDGVEAILSNSIQAPEESVICSDLRTFLVAERMYTAQDKSVAAIIFGIKRFHKLLRGKRFTIVTDQPTFVKVFHPATLFQVVPEKWNKIAAALALFNYNIIYRPSPPKRNMSPSLILTA